MTSRPLADVRARRGTLPTIVATTIALVVGIIAGPSVATAAVAEAPTPVTSRSDGIAASGVVKAADMSQFRPGNIISDAVFYNGNGMSEGQVQDFLDSQVPTCRSGYVCLKNKTDQTRQIAADPMCSAYRGGGVESAARIITKVGQACGINPQVLIVMLQKEQGLVTDTYPYDSQYRIAMGQGCPDTSGCDSAYYGFFNQVYGAARQLKRYENPPGTSNFFTWYAPGRTWSILYHPPALVNGQWVDQCGSSPVYIENKATSALYYYTPYQPNAASLRAGSGEGDRCSSYGNRNFYRFFYDWFGPSTTAGDPFGYVDSVQPLVGGARFRGWVADPDTSAPAQVHFYIGSTGHAVTAADNRPDVAAAYPQLGAGHGYDVVLPVPPGATTRVCAYAINVAGPGTNRLMECRDVTPLSGDPVGSWDSLSAVEGGFRLRGWGADPDSLASLTVRVRVDGSDQTIRADKARMDLARVMVAHGVNRAYDTVIPATPGRHTVCLTSINIGAGSNVDLGCRTVTVAPLPERGRLPIGNVDEVKIGGTRLTVRGWAIDPDTASAIDVHIYVDGKGTVARANRNRPDVGNAYGSYGPAHGFQVQQTIPEGPHSVCVYAINTVGDNPLLGCRTIVATSFEPRGYLDDVDVVPGGVRVRGWAIDDDIPGASLDVHVYVGSKGVALSADRSRPDVAAAFPAAGGKHGFDSVVAAASGVQRICAYAINVPGGANPLLGCKTVTVPSTSR